MEMEIKELIKEVAEKNQNDWSKEYKENSAKYINLVENLNDVSELKIHKILYFAYGKFGNLHNGEKLIKNAKFESWRHGPVEINYRNNQNINLIFNESQRESLENIILKLIKYNVWTLVDLSHRTDPWIKAGEGRRIHQKHS